MYNTKTGEVKFLPSMLIKRKGCSTVITGDIIVVMGGENETYEVFRRVECFKIGSSSARTHLPSMIEKRQEATAIVLPFKRTYV